MKHGGKTQEQITALKKSYGEIICITIKNPDRHFWFKKPDINTVSAASAVLETNPVQANKIFFINCLIEGDEKAIDNPDDYYALAPSLMSLIKKQEVEIKNF